MPYSNGHPIKLAGGRFALDLVNTANWSEDGQIVDEKIETLDDLRIWVDALDLTQIEIPPNVGQFRELRSKLRQFLELEERPHRQWLNSKLNDSRLGDLLRDQSLTTLAVMSAFSIATDPREVLRLKKCPAENCGWMFIDETKNSRRTWCLMETCGNRAKAKRHYQRTLAARSTT